MCCKNINNKFCLRVYIQTLNILSKKKSNRLRSSHQNVFCNVLGQLPPRKIAPLIIDPWINSPWMIAPSIITPQAITPKENYPPDNCPRGKLSLRHKISSKNNCPHPSNSPQRVLRVK